MNPYLFEYALFALLRQKAKNFFVLVVFALLIFLLFSVFFVTDAIRYELTLLRPSLPDIVVQHVKGGKPYDIDVSIVDDIITVPGVLDAKARVWGYYFFEQAGANFTLIGIDKFFPQHDPTFKSIASNARLRADSMIVGKGVEKLLKKYYYTENFNFIKPDGSILTLRLGGTFSGASILESDDVVVTSIRNVREIFDIPKTMATDVAVWVANPIEREKIAQKIRLEYPFTRVISIEDIDIAYENLFHYQSGVYLALFSIALFTFFVIVYDKANALGREEKHEIGILKALGWSISDVLKEKFYEGAILSFFAFGIGLSAAIWFVFFLDAPLLRNIFEGFSQLTTPFELPFVFNMQTVFLVFLTSVPIYIAATIVPAWKTAVGDADEAMR